MKPLPVGWLVIASLFWNAAAGLALAECGESGLQEPSVRSKVVVQGLVYPWSVAFLPTGELLVTERPGRLRVIRKGILLDEPVDGLPRLVNLFDVAVHPDFIDNHLIYLAFLAMDAGAVGLEVLRARLIDDRLVDNETVFRATPKAKSAPLSGGRLLFLSESALMITVGDRPDSFSNAQDPSNHFGTIVRVTDSGVDPNGNSSSDTLALGVHTFGHRNVQGIALDQETGEIWISEHGPAGGDELNILRVGGNYGWPIEHFGEAEATPIVVDATSQQSFEKPIHTWRSAIAPSGLAIYRGTRFPKWVGSIFVGSLIDCHVLRVRLGDDGKLLGHEELLGEYGERIRDIRVGPDEAVYVLTDEIDGKLISIEPLHRAQSSAK